MYLHNKLGQNFLYTFHMWFLYFFGLLVWTVNGLDPEDMSNEESITHSTNSFYCTNLLKFRSLQIKLFAPNHSVSAQISTGSMYLKAINFNQALGRLLQVDDEHGIGSESWLFWQS